MGKKMILITGGCRSGKSRFALEYGDKHFSRKLYLATCEPLDEEMVQRIAHHKKTRSPDWLTIEEPVSIVDKIRQHSHEADVILLDCMTLWLSNLLMRQKSDSEVIREMNALIDSMQERQSSFIMVSNEVGLGIVPADPLSRRFRDLSGIANQRIAEAADTVVFMVSGVPMFLKGR